MKCHIVFVAKRELSLGCRGACVRVVQAAHLLAERWGTELLVPIDKCTTMACVRCPLEAYDEEGVDLFKLIWDRFGIVVPLIQMPGVAGSWARISAQIYNELADYEKLAEAVLQLKQEKPGTEPI